MEVVHALASTRKQAAGMGWRRTTHSVHTAVASATVPASPARPAMPRINIPPLSRACLISCLTLSVLSGALRYRAWLAQHTSPGDTSQPPAHGGGSQLFTVPYLTVVPAQSLVYPWTFVTATLVEQNIFTLATTLGTLFYGGKYLERAWSSAEFAKFLLVLALVPNVVTFAVYIAWFAVTGNVMRSCTALSCRATEGLR